MENLTPEYEAVRFDSVALFVAKEMDDRFPDAHEIEDGWLFGKLVAYGHDVGNVAFDAGHAHAVAEIGELRAEISALERDIETLQYEAQEDRS